MSEQETPVKKIELMKAIAVFPGKLMHTISFQEVVTFVVSVGVIIYLWLQ